MARKSLSRSKRNIRRRQLYKRHKVAAQREEKRAILEQLRGEAAERREVKAIKRNKARARRLVEKLREAGISLKSPVDQVSGIEISQADLIAADTGLTPKEIYTLFFSP